jgi:hexulose-6-phosphate isomerase
MKKGINSSCFPAGMTLKEMFKWSSDAGYDGVELMMGDEPGAEFSIHEDEDGLMKIKQLADRYRMDLFGVATTLHWKYPLTDSDESTKQQGVSTARKMIDAAALFGSEMVLIVPGVVTQSVSYDEAYSRALKVMKQLAGYAEEKGVRVGVENVWNKFLLSPLEMAGFVEEIASPNVGVYFDVGNVLAFGYPEQWIRILAHRIFAVHVKDFRSRVGNINGFGPLLSGDVPWDRVRESLKRIGYSGYVTPEIQPHSEYPEQLIRETSRTLDFIFQQEGE